MKSLVSLKALGYSLIIAVSLALTGATQASHPSRSGSSRGMHAGRTQVSHPSRSGTSRGMHPGRTQVSYPSRSGSSRGMHPGRPSRVSPPSRQGQRDRHIGQRRFTSRQAGWTRHWLARYRCHGWWCPRTQCYYRWWSACGCYCPVDDCPSDLDDDDGPDNG
jgi:hypothetical protein